MVDALEIAYIVIAALLALRKPPPSSLKLPLTRVVFAEIMIVTAIMVWPIWLPPMGVYYIVQGFREKR